MEALREQRENTISTTRDELYSAQEEILVLRHAMEAANAEREREIAALQGDLSVVTAELDKWRQTAAKYEVEISNLQASFQLQSQHQERASQLQGTHTPTPFICVQQSGQHVVITAPVVNLMCCLALNVSVCLWMP